MSAAEMTEKLGLHGLRHRQWYIQACCATTGDGLYEGLVRILSLTYSLTYSLTHSLTYFTLLGLAISNSTKKKIRKYFT